jgi:hypothetical protein
MRYIAFNHHQTFDILNAGTKSQFGSLSVSVPKHSTNFPSTQIYLLVSSAKPSRNAATELVRQQQNSSKRKLSNLIKESARRVSGVHSMV